MEKDQQEKSVIVKPARLCANCKTSLEGKVKFYDPVQELEYCSYVCRNEGTRGY